MFFFGVYSFDLFKLKMDTEANGLADWFLAIHTTDPVLLSNSQLLSNREMTSRPTGRLNEVNILIDTLVVIFGLGDTQAYTWEGQGQILSVFQFEFKTVRLSKELNLHKYQGARETFFF